MQIELPNDLAEHIADLCDVWGADHRPAFVADIEERIYQSVENQKMIDSNKRST